MSTKELYELASLDALGFLDDEERRDFERMYAQATPEIQAQIRREQLRYAMQVELLPDVEPPAGLKSKVMSAVRQAIAGVSNEPVATIGPESFSPIQILNQTPFWRAACFAFAAATVVLSLFSVRVNDRSDSIEQALRTNQLYDDIVDDLGPQFVNVLLSREFSDISFAPTATDADSTRPEGRLFANQQQGTAYILLRNLAEMQGEYTLEFTDPEGRVVMSETFVNMGGVVTVPMKLGEGVNPHSARVASPRGVGGESRVILETTDL